MVYVGCTLTDSAKSIYTGNYTFWHTRTYGYLVLDLPLHSGLRNLRTFINDNNPGSKTEVHITNNRTVPTIETGNLSGLTVTFTNNGYIRAYSRTDGNVSDGWTKGALQVTSAMKLINNGWIQGCGGRGGTGGKGYNDTYYTNEVQTYYQLDETYGEFWRVRPDVNYADMYWDGHDESVHDANFQGPWTASDGTKNLYRGDYVWTDSAGKKFYKIDRRYQQLHSRTGGGGGAGGRGYGYGLANTWSSIDGSAGSASSPSGGNSGGRGGHGGYWGNTGYTAEAGTPNGAAGGGGWSAGKSIIGTSHLTAGSKQGNKNGGTLS